MQEHVVDQGAAEHVEASWYLIRDGKQYGPLTHRELSLLAEGANFKTGDLVWTAGLDSWKPADAVFKLVAPSQSETEQAVDAQFSVEPSLEPEDDKHDPVEPNGEDVDALVQALHASAEVPKPTLKERALAEIKKFAGIVAYLWVVFTVLLVHEWVVLSENHIGFKFYGLAVINAVVLGKIMLLAEHFRFAERLNKMPLIYPILYKAVGFTTLLFAAYILEEMLIGWLGGKGFAASVPHVGGGTLLGGLSIWFIFCVALLPFFGFKEIERAVGPGMVRKLLFGRI